MEFICKVIFAWLEWWAQNRAADETASVWDQLLKALKGALIQETFYGVEGGGERYNQNDTWTR